MKYCVVLLLCFPTGVLAISWRVFSVMENLTRWWHQLWSTAQRLMKVSVRTTLSMSAIAFSWGVSTPFNNINLAAQCAPRVTVLECLDICKHVDEEEQTTDVLGGPLC